MIPHLSIEAVLADILDTASKVGTFSMQALLALGLIILGIVVIYLHRSSEKQRALWHVEDRRTQADFIAKMEAKDNAITAERIARIQDLMNRITTDTEVKTKLLNSVDNNTQAVVDLKRFLEQWIQRTVNTREK